MLAKIVLVATFPPPFYRPGIHSTEHEIFFPACPESVSNVLSPVLNVAHTRCSNSSGRHATALIASVPFSGSSYSLVPPEV